MPVHGFPKVSLDLLPNSGGKLTVDGVTLGGVTDVVVRATRDSTTVSLDLHAGFAMTERDAEVIIRIMGLDHERAELFKRVGEADTGTDSRIFRAAAATLDWLVMSHGHLSVSRGKSLADFVADAIVGHHG